MSLDFTDRERRGGGEESERAREQELQGVPLIDKGTADAPTYREGVVEGLSVLMTCLLRKRWYSIAIIT